MYTPDSRDGGTNPSFFFCNAADCFGSLGHCRFALTILACIMVAVDRMMDRDHAYSS
jgi:hypothetical protein